MSVLRDFALPDLGEGLTESEIVSWHVAPGDTVALNQIIAEVETAKALVELPSPFAGVVAQLYAQPGTTVRVGAPIVAFEIDDGSPTDAVEPAGSAAESAAASSAVSTASSAATATETGSAAAGRQSVLVGYGPEIETGERPKRRARRTVTGRETTDGAAGVGRDAGTTSVAAQPTPEMAPPGQPQRPRSTPPVRRLARDLGIDLAHVTGTGERGLVTREDVEAFATAPGAAPASRDERSGDMRIPITGVRKHMAQAMVTSAFSAPHVTEFLTVDVTPAMELLASLRSRPEFRDHRLNVLTLVAKALCIAVARTPQVNARWDEAAGEIIQFGSVNLGIAAATPRGLLVPNIVGADLMTLAQLADALTELTATARAGQTTPARLSGGTITITNVGVFGIDAGTPILNPGEAAILAMGAVRTQPWEYRGEIALRRVITLSLSFDHRMVDGEQGARFLTDIGSVLAEPGLVLSMV